VVILQENVTAAATQSAHAERIENLVLRRDNIEELLSIERDPGNHRFREIASEINNVLAHQLDAQSKIRGNNKYHLINK
jgi:hypothetical protein